MPPRWEIVDGHVESFVWTRILGYDLAVRHGDGLLGGRYYSQADLPRMREAGMAGAVMSVATNPFRRAERRTDVLLANLARLRRALESDPRVAVVAGHAGYRAARAEGRLACFLGVQGANAWSRPEDAARTPVVTRATLVHLTDSPLGATSSPLGRSRGRGGLTPLGREYVAALNDAQVLVDLAHISRPGFWDALAAHDPHLPLVVSHTGVCGVRPSWRNLDDDQIRAVADRGGVVGIMFHRGFLGRPSWRVTAGAVVAHLAHLIAVGGEDVAALGSDYDGMIVPPRDLRTVLDLPRLVERMRAAGFSDDRVGGILGANYLRVVETIRPAS
ncbi:MAG TPA: membrane dipeptidase [Acidimicrobiia bacterium]